ncbi:MAG: hypothetical protein A2W25_08640 [candidate division Zixibacteria bacterium RBG_16_53_22]|nr:MAG: hypothetical protein A2W25_08640 [candidate division Zixibacteria bacterium RBG_16_53_22]
MDFESRENSSVVRAAIILASLIFLTCGWPLRNDKPPAAKILTSDKLMEIHKDVRFTRFYYDDGLIKSGLLLRWMTDSILIQERGQGSPTAIPAAGIGRLETITGNEMLEGLVIGSLVGAAYFVAVGGYDLGTVTFGEAMVKLLVTPAIIITGMAIGAGRDKTETFIVPPDFRFDYEETGKTYQPRQ